MATTSGQFGPLLSGARKTAGKQTPVPNTKQKSLKMNSTGTKVQNMSKGGRNKC